MSRKTKVVGVSLPPETHKKVEEFIKNNHKTRSEFYREMIANYFVDQEPGSRTNVVSETSIAKTLKKYWKLRSQNKLKLIIISLGIITNSRGRILIGAREQDDEWVENLNWVFPGGRLSTLDFEKETKEIIKKKTNLDVSVENLVSARVHPDSGFKPVQIIATYFHCKSLGSSRIKTSEDLKKLVWVDPLDVFRYFTTSTSDEVTKFLATLEKSQTT